MAKKLVVLSDGGTGEIRVYLPDVGAIVRDAAYTTLVMKNGPGRVVLAQTDEAYKKLTKQWEAVKT
jgi:hypothetical protein